MSPQPQLASAPALLHGRSCEDCACSYCLRLPLYNPRSGARPAFLARLAPPTHCHKHQPPPAHPTHPASAAMRAPCMPRCTTPCSAYCRCTSSTLSTQVSSSLGQPLTAGQGRPAPAICLCLSAAHASACAPAGALLPTSWRLGVEARAVVGCALCRRARPGAAVRLPPAGGPAPHHLPHLLRAAAGAGAGGKGGQRLPACRRRGGCCGRPAGAQCCGALYSWKHCLFNARHADGMLLSGASPAECACQAGMRCCSSASCAPQHHGFWLPPCRRAAWRSAGRPTARPASGLPSGAAAAVAM